MERMSKKREEKMRDNDKKIVLRGCIKTTKGPWLVHRNTKGGGSVTKLRFPTERERQNNKERERKRRAVTRKIFDGLRRHGNYNLKKQADSNDLLMALCEEAGWQVEANGTVYRKESCQVSDETNQWDDDDYCKCNDHMNSFASRPSLTSSKDDIKLSISLTLSPIAHTVC